MPKGVYKRTEKSNNALGKHWKLSDITKKKISINNARFWLNKKRPPPSEETRGKLSKALRGERSYLWRGGISFEPYSTDWTEDLRRAIRKRDRYTCKLCGKEPSVHIHHIDYDKKNCDPKNLITLCIKCNAKVNFNRNYWTNYFFGLNF